MPDLIMPKRAIISVTDKAGLEEFGPFLQNKGVEIISTGGTAKYLEDHGVSVMDASDVTGFPEMFDGRVKTMHPNILGAILFERNKVEHADKAREHKIKPIDMVVVNPYDFEGTISDLNVSAAKAIEAIDVGGPTMLRSAAKNFAYITIVPDRLDYEKVMNMIDVYGGINTAYRYDSARRVFKATSAYDGRIANWFFDNTKKLIAFAEES